MDEQRAVELERRVLKFIDIQDIGTLYGDRIRFGQDGAESGYRRLFPASPYPDVKGKFRGEI